MFFKVGGFIRVSNYNHDISRTNQWIQLKKNENLAVQWGME